MKNREGRTGLGIPQTKTTTRKPRQDAKKQSVLDTPREMEIATKEAND